MKKDLEITAQAKGGNHYNEIEVLKSCLTRYFESQPGSLPLKDMELSILATLSIYFHGYTRL
jgi:hypothetical protein